VGEEHAKLKQYALAGGAGLLVGVVGTLAFTKWIPEYQEKAARRQGEIIAQELEKRLKNYKGAADGE
jgi:hypothetical protein